MKKNLILGGYGNFGKRIPLSLVKAGLPIIIAERNLSAAKSLCKSILKPLPNAQIDIACFDINIDLMQQLQHNRGPEASRNNITHNASEHRKRLSRWIFSI